MSVPVRAGSLRPPAPRIRATTRAAPGALREATTAVITEAAGPGTVLPAPLVGVTPVGYLLARPSSATVATAADRLRRGADRNPTRSIAAVDMSAGSADPGPAIRPTSVVLVSVPAVDAPLLAAAPTFGLDLPLRFVVRADEQTRTQVGYPDPRRLAARHGLAPDDPNLARLAAEADRLAGVAAGTPATGAAS
jgi:uncharacterized protein (DUF302 family)